MEVMASFAYVVCSVCLLGFVTGSAGLKVEELVYGLSQV